MDRSTNKKECILFVMAAYRQSSIPSYLGLLNSNTTQSQISRYTTLCNQVEKVNKLIKDIMIMTDDNINSLEDNSLTNFYKNIQLKHLKDEMMINNSLIEINNKPTFFRPSIKLCMDHIISNCPSKISCVTTHSHYNSNPTHNIVISDYLILTAIYNNKEIVVPQLYTTIRNNKLLTRERLQQLWDINDIIKST